MVITMKSIEHVVPSERGWAVKSAYAVKAARVFATKNGAIRYADDLAERNRSCYAVHGMDGRFEEFACH